ncbi:MAG: hypothetical protein ACHQ16_03945 [Candidatus Lutacidiplasmatales archaeon]
MYFFEERTVGEQGESGSADPRPGVPEHCESMDAVKNKPVRSPGDVSSNCFRPHNRGSMATATELFDEPRGVSLNPAPNSFQGLADEDKPHR